MYADYCFAKCAAITRAGTRCTGRWSTAQRIVLAWNPCTGEGADGPYLVLCHRHRLWMERVKDADRPRFPVVHGWLGVVEPHGYYRRIFETRTGRAVSRWWLRHRRPVGPNIPTRKDAA